MKILVFSGFFYPFAGGLTNSTMDSIQGFIKNGHAVTVLTCNTENIKSEETHQGVHIVRLPCWNLLKGTYPIPKPTCQTWRLLRKLWHIKWDVIWTQTRFFSTSLLGAIFAKIKRIPYVHTERGAVHVELMNPVLNALAHLYDHTIGWFVVHGAAQSVGVSHETARFVEHLGGKNAIGIFNGINFQTFKKNKDKEKLREKYHLPKTVFLMAFVGRLIEAKGCQDILKAMQTMNQEKQGDKMHLIIVGEGNYDQALHDAVKACNLESQVTFLGGCNTKEVIELLSLSDLFINPSYAEGFPRCVLEASAIGMPIVATDVGGTKEIIGDSERGILIPMKKAMILKKAIVKMKDDEKFRNKMAQNSLEFARQHFSSEQNAAKYLEVFRTITT